MILRNWRASQNNSISVQQRGKINELIQENIPELNNVCLLFENTECIA